MFATLIGAYPAAREPSARRRCRSRHVVEELAEAGLEPISDGRGAERAATPDDVERIVAAWRLAASATDRAVKQALVGPVLAGSRRRHGPSASPAAIAEAIRGDDRGTCGRRLPADRDRGAGRGRCRRRRGRATPIRRCAADGDGGPRRRASTCRSCSRAATPTRSARRRSSTCRSRATRSTSSRGPTTGGSSPRRRPIGGSSAERSIRRPARRTARNSSSGPPTTRPRSRAGASSVSASPMRRASAGLSRERARAKVEVLATAARLAATASPDELAAALDPRAVDIRSAAARRVHAQRPQVTGTRRPAGRLGSGVSPCA